MQIHLDSAPTGINQRHLEKNGLMEGDLLRRNFEGHLQGLTVRTNRTTCSLQCRRDHVGILSTEAPQMKSNTRTELVVRLFENLEKRFNRTMTADPGNPLQRLVASRGRVKRSFFQRREADLRPNEGQDL